MRYYSEEDVSEMLAKEFDEASSYSKPYSGVKMSDYPSIEIPQSNWHTGTPTETGLYVVLTEVETIGIHSSKGTYILDWWDGYFFKNLKDIVQNSPIHRIKEYSWVKWQKIEED